MSREDDGLRQALRGYAAEIAETHRAPEASAVWLRAERRRRRLAIERAERPLRIMQVVGLLCAACAAVWMLWRTDALHALPAIGTTGLMLGLAGAALVLGGCWTMVAASRRPAAGQGLSGRG